MFRRLPPEGGYIHFIIPLYLIFNENGFTMSDEYRERLNLLSSQAHSLINEYFEAWLEGTIHCKSVEAMTQLYLEAIKANKQLAAQLETCKREYASVAASTNKK